MHFFIKLETFAMDTQTTVTFTLAQWVPRPWIHGAFRCWLYGRSFNAQKVFFCLFFQNWVCLWTLIHFFYSCQVLTLIPSIPLIDRNQIFFWLFRATAGIRIDYKFRFFIRGEFLNWCLMNCVTFLFSMDSSRLDDEHKLIARYAQRLAQEARTVVSLLFI